jgi:phosphatidylglycerol---prolipoprotein diacylglyceryl transferase
MRPILFHLPLPFGLDVGFPAYGTCLVLGMLAAAWVSGRHGELLGIRRRDAFDLGVWLLAAALVGAHLLHVAYYPSLYFSSGTTTGLKRAVAMGPGLVYYGGLAAAFPVLWFWGRRRGLVYLDVLDFVAPLGALGLGITRVGCFLNGCCFGIPSSAPWAVRFPVGSLPHRAQVAVGLISPGQETLAVLPVQLFEAAVALALFGWLWARFPRRRFRGELVVAFGLCYGVWRILAEAMRADAPGWRPGVLAPTPSQWVSLAAIALSLLAGWRLRRAPIGPRGSV